MKHHGEIIVSSEVGSGTTFEILLPCSKDLSSSKVVEHQMKSGAGTVLLVDDEEINRHVGKDVLESLGYNVVLAENGLQAVSVFLERSDEIDITILDMIMPEMNGTKAFHKMKEIDENCKVIIATGHIEIEDISSLLDNGLVGYIKKPYQIKEISSLLYKTMNRKTPLE